MNHDTPRVWRLILSPPASGPLNMAMDEAILESVTARMSPPTLRLYAWEPPCLSIGYAQPVSDVEFARLDRLGWDCVRRPTGGRAILHTDELTYAVIVPAKEPVAAGGVLPSYQRLSRGLIAALGDLGLHAQVKPNTVPPERNSADPVCFQVPSAYEITVGGRKLIGSAQLRRLGGVLQHGSLPLGGDVARICQGLRYDDDRGREEASKRVRERATTLEACLGKPIRWNVAAEAVAQGFAQALGFQGESGEITQHENRRAQLLAAKRYANLSWTQRL